jgi:MFS family permease
VSYDFRRLSPGNVLALNRPPDEALTPAQVEANIRHLVGDIAWFGVTWGSIVAFLQVYTVRLGASSLLVGAITYGPALVAIFLQIPAGRLMQRVGYRMRWAIATGLAYRLFFLTVALLPFFIMRGRAEATALVWVLSSCASSFSNVAFLSMMADAVPANRLQQMVGLRIAAFGLVNTITTLAAGPLLQRLPFPLNYQILFLIGFAGSMVSWWHVRRIHVPEAPALTEQQPAFWREMRGIFRFPGYVRFVVPVFFLQLALGMMSPLLPLYWVRTLGATDGQVSLVLSMAMGTMVISSLLMRRMVGRVGRERALAIGGAGYMLYPLLTSLTTSVWWLIPWAALAGLFNAAITVNLFDNLVSVTPVVDRSNYIAVHSTIQNGALFLGPIIGGVLAAGAGGPVLGLRVAAGVGLFAGILFALRRPAGAVRA